VIVWTELTDGGITGRPVAFDALYASRSTWWCRRMHANGEELTAELEHPRRRRHLGDSRQEFAAGCRSAV
jgi:hypothetical protein